MRVVRRFNNNIVLALDGRGNEVVVFGKGVGFREIPYELTDLSAVEKTYYQIENRYMGMFSAISEQSLEIAAKVVDLARKRTQGIINPNLLVTLADHIDFCVERYRKNYIVQAPLFYDFEQMYPVEFELGKETLRLVYETFRLRLLNSEIVGIGMNILNAELDTEHARQRKSWDGEIEEMTAIIERKYGFPIDRSSGDYARYISHMQYLMLRVHEGNQGGEDFVQLYEELKLDSPRGAECANQISDYITRKFCYKLNREELLYLNMHITRLCSREECNRKGITSEE